MQRFKLICIAAFVLISSSVFAQTAPTPQTLPYTQDFSALAHASTVYPSSLVGWQLSSAANSAFITTGPTGDRALIASSSASNNSGGIHNYNGKIGILTSGSANPGIVISLVTTGQYNVTVKYDAMVIRNPYDGTTNTRINEFGLQYRIGNTGSWITVVGPEYQSGTTLQTGSGVTTPQNQQTKSIALPDATDNQPEVQIRWLVRDVSGGGSRPSFAVDNISIEQDFDGDGYVASLDCNDTNPTINPGAGENCNGVDDDCDGLIDEGTYVNFYLDNDADLFGDPSISTLDCVAPTGFVGNNLDCNDADAAVNPNADEICNGIDDNCNGLADNADPGIIGQPGWFADADGDGFGDAAIMVFSCDMPVGYTGDPSDCDDTQASVNPGAVEICDGLDNDCNGIPDDGLPTVDYYVDSDGDGFGTEGGVTLDANSVVTTEGSVMVYNDGTSIGKAAQTFTPSISGEFSEFQFNINTLAEPGMLINFQLSTGAIPGGGTLLFSTGVVVNTTGWYSILVPGGITATAGEQYNFAIYPSAVSTNMISLWRSSGGPNPGQHDGGAWLIYNDLTDDFTPSGIDDLDFRQYVLGGAGPAITSCADPGAGFSDNALDCNDANSAVNPSGIEECNGIDDDCNGIVDDGLTSTFYADADGDLYGDDFTTIVACELPVGYWYTGGDCNDADAMINPGSFDDVCAGIDRNCDGIVDLAPHVLLYADADGDGYGSDIDYNYFSVCALPTGYIEFGGDCNDGNAAVFPGAAEICDGADNDCNGFVDEGLTFITYFADADGDTYGNAFDLINSCDGIPAGYVADATDCDDSQSTVYPGATEICDGLDNDCDGEYDEGTVSAVVSPTGVVTTCKGVPSVLTANNGIDYTYQWFKNGNVIAGATNITYGATKPGYYQVQVNTPAGCFALSEATTVQVLPSPNANISAPNGTSLCTSVKLKASFDATYTYQWRNGGTPIAGATSYLYFPTVAGSYTCTVTTASGCSRTTAAIAVTACREAEENTAANMLVYPNPAAQSVCVQVLGLTGDNAMVQLVDMTGRVLVEQNVAVASIGTTVTIDLNDIVASGMYFVRVVNAAQELTESVIIQK